MNTRDMREMNSMDGRNPYGYRGGYVTNRRPRRGRRGDRGMDYAQNQMDYRDMRGDYRSNNMGDMARGYDRASQDYGYDGHYPQSQGSTYYPIQAMGTFEGYYGMPEQDYARGGRGRQDYGYDMRSRGRGRDYGYDYGDYGDDYGDYGETLSEEELEHWCKKLKGQLDEREKQIFSKEAIMQKIKSLNRPMENFSEKEWEVATLMAYTDDKEDIGQNLDLSVKLGYRFLADKDTAVKGAEKLAVYYDCIVEGEEE